MEKFFHEWVENFFAVPEISVGYFYLLSAKGNGCSAVVEHTPWNKEDVSSNSTTFLQLWSVLDKLNRSLEDVLFLLWRVSNKNGTLGGLPGFKRAQ